MALFGSLAPRGAILKRSAADNRLFEREGRAVVFRSLEDLAARIDDPNLDVTRRISWSCRTRARAARPRHARGGYLPIPKKLAARPASRTWCGSRTRA